MFVSDAKAHFLEFGRTSLRGTSVTSTIHDSVEIENGFNAIDISLLGARNGDRPRWLSKYRSEGTWMRRTLSMARSPLGQA